MTCAKFFRGKLIWYVENDIMVNHSKIVGKGFDVLSTYYVLLSSVVSRTFLNVEIIQKAKK